VLLAAPAAATTVIPLTTRDLARKADIICTGTCVRSQSFLDRSLSDAQRINTNYLIQVDKTLKGDPQQFLVVTEWGGQVGEVLQWIAGTPRYETGEKVLVFLKKTSGGIVTIGMSQGKYHVYKEKGTGKEMVRRDLSGLEFVDPKHPKAGEYIQKPKDPSRIYLSDFIDEIQHEVGRRRNRR